ncbi:hypothetical protein CPB97_009265 [Podila verticillata]|nr:hypothetical protein CPB97_009265 [Podila verticillata]
MPNDGSLDVLPVSPCTSGSLGLDHHFLGTAPLKVIDNHSTSSLKESHVTQVQEKAVVVDVRHEMEEEKKEEFQTEDTEHEREHEHDHAEHEEEYQEEANGEEREAEPVEGTTHVEAESVKEVAHEVHNAVEDLAEKTHKLMVTTVTPPAAALALVEEKKASEIPEQPAKSDMPTYAATRGLSAASLALKKKQAAQNALAATKTMAVEVPETDSISNRIKMFGGGNPGRIGVPHVRKMGVRDMVQKFKDVEDLNLDQIAHVAKGHDTPGVCSVYSLSTASRPVNALRSTPRRKMSHELSEHETRSIVKATVSGYSRASEEDPIGVSQESVQSVRNAKSLFENLGRSEGAQQ